jgi:nucleoside-diphosphate-sugar epimerase
LHYRADILGDDTAICSNVLQAAVHHGLRRFVYISSSMVYDSCVQDLAVPLVENMTDSCALPRTDYGLGKLVCERMCEAFRQQYHLEYTIWRPFNIVSPHEVSMTEQGFSHVLPDFINNIVGRRLNPLPIIGNGEQIRCFTWIDDVTDIMVNHSFGAASANQVFNICNVEPTRMKDAARMIYTALGRNANELEFVTSREYEHDVRVRVPSVEKLQRMLGPFRFTSTQESIKRCLTQAGY